MKTKLAQESFSMVDCLYAVSRWMVQSVGGKEIATPAVGAALQVCFAHYDLHKTSCGAMTESVATA
jgi:RimJ/RimL family protein N-acetyltransferase